MPNEKNTPAAIIKWIQNYSDENGGEIIITDGRIFLTNFETSTEVTAEQLAELWNLHNPNV